MSIIYPIFVLAMLTFMVVFGVGASRLISVQASGESQAVQADVGL